MIGFAMCTHTEVGQKFALENHNILSFCHLSEGLIFCLPPKNKNIHAMLILFSSKSTSTMANRPPSLPPLPPPQPINQSIPTVETSSTHSHEAYPQIPITDPATTAVLSPSQFELRVMRTHTTASATASPTSTLTRITDINPYTFC